ncbi:phage integrase central domain-containing protein [Oligella sp. MSHR50489EDL]|uniref:phage integrase central domain-containing protein n=1 Tax=Oligella sp. MSHR50489EDL TaxID=3139409 RepID=UPI003D818D63
MIVSLTSALRYITQTDFSDSSRALRLATYERDIKPLFGHKSLDEISSDDIRRHCYKIRDTRNAPATAVFVRDFFNATYKFAQLQGVEIDNPAESIANSSIARFRARSSGICQDSCHSYINFKLLFLLLNHSPDLT